MQPFQPPLASLHPIGDRSAGALVTSGGSICWWTPERLSADATCFALVGSGGATINSSIDNPTYAIAERGEGSAPALRSEQRSYGQSLTIEDHLADGRHGFAKGTIVRMLTAGPTGADVRTTIVPGGAFDNARKTFHHIDGTAWTFAGAKSRVVSVRGTNHQQLAPYESMLITVSTQGDDQRVRREEYDRRMRSLQREWRHLLESSFNGVWQSTVRIWFRQLLLLTDAESGAVCRTFTTSLPAQLNGDRQLDERFAYLEDAARFIRLCERVERPELAQRTRDWLADATLQGSHRARSLPAGADTELGAERETALAGWRRHSPVRIGNSQTTTVDLAAYAQASLMLNGAQHLRAIQHVATVLDDQFRNPSVLDRGRWSQRTANASRGNSQNGTNLPYGTSFISAAIASRQALNAAAATTRKNNPLSLDALNWTETANNISTWLRSEGCFGAASTAGWRRSQNDNSSDAELLRWIAPAERGHDFPQLANDDEYEAKIRTTNSLSQLLAQLDDNGLVHRHLPHVDDGFAPGQGSDVSASADVVTALCRLNRWDEAHSRMEYLCSAINGTVDTVGTVPSHIDPRTHEHLGNRPYAPALLSLCEAALALSEGPV